MVHQYRQSDGVFTHPQTARDYPLRLELQQRSHQPRRRRESYRFRFIQSQATQQSDEANRRDWNGILRRTGSYHRKSIHGIE